MSHTTLFVAGDLCMKILFSLTTLSIFLIVGCKALNSPPSDQPIIYTTLFITYDFAQVITNNKIQVELFLPPGVDTHTYEPSANDILKANKSTLFLWTSSTMEPWMPKLIKTLGMSKSIAINLADEMHLTNLNDDDHHHHDGNHNHKTDPHFWMNPQLLLPLFDTITQLIIKMDPPNKTFYEENAKVYRHQLATLVEEIDNNINQSNKIPLLFGGGFSHRHFINQYNLPYYSVYHSDSIENEPTIAHIASIHSAIERHNLQYIFVDPMLTTKIATTLAEDYNLQILFWHTGHTVSKEDLNNQISYLDLLKENKLNIQRALNHAAV